MPRATAWKNLETSLLSDTRQTPRDKCCIFQLEEPWSSHIHGAEHRMPAARGLGGGSDCLMGLDIKV